MFKAGFVESWGRGFEKIKLTCQASKVPIPEITKNTDGIMIKCNPSENYLKLLRKELDDTETIDYGYIKFRLKDILRERKISAYKLAYMIHITPSYLYAYLLKDNIRNLNVNILARLCCVLNCDIGDLIEYKEEKTEEENE